MQMRKCKIHIRLGLPHRAPHIQRNTLPTVRSCILLSSSISSPEGVNLAVALMWQQAGWFKRGRRYSQIERDAGKRHRYAAKHVGTVFQNNRRQAVPSRQATVSPCDL